MLRLNKITKTFGELRALDSFSCTINPKRITALVGPNGAGKTTLFNTITGTLIPDSGKVFLGNSNISNMEPYMISGLGVSRVFQQITYFRNLTLMDHLSLCLNINDKMFSNLFLQNSLKRKRTRRMKEILKLVGIDKPLKSNAYELSYGQKKLLGLAMAIIHPHRILLLDEPVAGVNPLLKKKIKDILLALKERGETIFIIEHDMTFVKAVADEIIVINNGKILASGTPSEVLKDRKVIEAYLGE